MSSDSISRGDGHLSQAATTHTVIEFLCNESKDKTGASNAKGKDPSIAEKIFAAEVLLDSFANPTWNGTRSGAITLTELFFQRSGENGKEREKENEKEKVTESEKESKKKQKKSKKEKGANGSSQRGSGSKRGVPDAASVTNLFPSTGYTENIPIMAWFLNSVSQETAEALQIHDVTTRFSFYNS